MRRLIALTFLVFAGIPTTPSKACELKTCPPFQGQPSDILYYVIASQPSPFTVRHTYIDTGTTAGIILDDGTGPYKRVVHEFRSPVVQAVCEADRANFENTLGISSQKQIAGELYQVKKRSNGKRLGTVFIDRGNTGVLATGGTMGVDLTYECSSGGQPEPVMQKVALFHSGLDLLGIEGATPATIETEYLSKIRTRLTARARSHMVAQNCVEVSYDDFVAAVNAGTECKLHYDNGDPGPGMAVEVPN